MRWGWLLMVLTACDTLFGIEPRPPVPIDAPPDTIGSGAWSEPVPVEGLFLTGTEDDVTFTADLLQAFFNLEETHIAVATRDSVDAAWGPPVILEELGSPLRETTPRVTTDGLVMVFASNRNGNYDMYLSTRTSTTSGWEPPDAMVDLNSSAIDQAATVDAEKLHLAFASSRVGPAGGGQSDIYVTRRASTFTGWDSPIAATAINSPGFESSMFMSADALTLYFQSNRAGDDDLYRTVRASPLASFESPTPMTEFNTVGGIEGDPWISPDGHHFFFVRKVAGISTLYHATR